MVKYDEVPDEKLSSLTAEEKIDEIKRALEWISDNYIEKKTAFKQNNYLYVHFADVVQRLIEK